MVDFWFYLHSVYGPSTYLLVVTSYALVACK